MLLRGYYHCTVNIPLIIKYYRVKRLLVGANKIVIDVTYEVGALWKFIEYLKMASLIC